MKQHIKLHVKHKYYIRAQQLSELNAVQVTYPSSILFDEKSDIQNYIYHSIDDYIIVYKEDINDEPLCQLKSPNYCHRILMLEDVFLYTLSKNFNTDLIVCFNKNNKEVKGKQPLVKLMRQDLSEEDQKKEKNLSALFYELVLGQDNLDKAEKFNVVEGYRVVTNVLENEGICK